MWMGSQPTFSESQKSQACSWGQNHFFQRDINPQPPVARGMLEKMPVDQRCLGQDLSHLINSLKSQAAIVAEEKKMNPELQVLC